MKITISEPRIVIHDLELAPGTIVNYWPLTHAAAAELRDRLDKAIYDLDERLNEEAADARRE